MPDIQHIAKRLSVLSKRLKPVVSSDINRELQDLCLQLESDPAVGRSGKRKSSKENVAMFSHMIKNGIRGRKLINE